MYIEKVECIREHFSVAYYPQSHKLTSIRYQYNYEGLSRWTMSVREVIRLSFGLHLPSFGGGLRSCRLSFSRLSRTCAVALFLTPARSQNLYLGVIRLDLEGLPCLEGGLRIAYVDLHTSSVVFSLFTQGSEPLTTDRLFKFYMSLVLFAVDQS